MKIKRIIYILLGFIIALFISYCLFTAKRVGGGLF